MQISEGIRMHRRLTSISAFVLVVAGCSGSPGASPSTDPGVSPIQSAPASATATPVRTPALAQLDGRLAFDHIAGHSVSLWGNTVSGIGPLFPNLGGEHGGASWSPDGTRLLFNVLLPTGARIYESVSGAAPAEIATGCKPPDCLEDGWQAISADGDRLAFRRIFGTGEPTSSGIVIADISGAHGKGLTEVSWSALEDKAPSWSPDGTMVVFAREQHDKYGITGSVLYILTVATGEIRRLTPEGVSAADPDWSANGLIVFGAPIDPDGLTTSDVWVIAPDGTGLHNLTAGTSVAGAAATPAWMEGGIRIVFSRSRGASTAEIWVMNADGSHPQQVTAAGGLNAFPAVVP